MRLVFWCLDTFGNAIGRPMLALGSFGLGHWIEERFATSFLMIWHMEFSIGRPTPLKGHRAYEVLWNLPHLAYGHCTLLLSILYQ